MVIEMLGQYVLENSTTFFLLEMFEMYAGIYDKTVSIIFIKTCCKGKRTEETLEEFQVF